VPFEYSIRDARLEDMPDIREIYNHYVATPWTVTFDEVREVTQETWSKFQHLKKLGIPTLRSLVSQQILGYALRIRGSEKAPIVSPSRTRSTFALRPPEKGSKSADGEPQSRGRSRPVSKEIIAVIADCWFQPSNKRCTRLRASRDWSHGQGRVPSEKAGSARCWDAKSSSSFRLR
jgi:phosphinothricin acetyltransferase